MTSDQTEDPRTKFRQAFRMLGEAAGEVLREGITRIDRARRGSPETMTEPMRQAGAEILRKHGVDKLITNPDGTPASFNRSELFLREVATEVFDAMRNVVRAEEQDRSRTMYAGSATPSNAAPGNAAPESTTRNSTAGESVAGDSMTPDDATPEVAESGSPNSPETKYSPSTEAGASPTKQGSSSWPDGNTS
jgi:hypothetical protein